MYVFPLDCLSKSMKFRQLSEDIFSKSSPAETCRRRILMILGAGEADDLCFHEHLKSFNSTDSSLSYRGKRELGKKSTDFILKKILETAPQGHGGAEGVASTGLWVWLKWWKVYGKETVVRKPWFLHAKLLEFDLTIISTHSNYPRSLLSRVSALTTIARLRR